MKKASDTIEFFKQMLGLYAQLCVGGHDDALFFLLKGSSGENKDKDNNNNNNNNNNKTLSISNFNNNNNQKVDPFFTADQVFQCAQNANLPGSLRAAFVRLLTLIVEEELPQTQAGVKLTWV